ncbi:MAG: tetratricopeptide repeat protein [Chitinophagales bacterium]|nr:tetratricopeptide repeat protein [Chitinophagales bacterium]
MIKTLLLTDIVDSTALTQEVGNERMSEIWVEHDRIARDLLQEHDGQEADRTDGFLMLFDDPTEACFYAQKLHLVFDQISSKENINFKARIGIHTGEIILLETTEEHRAAGVKHIEVEGIAKPTAARVMSVAAGGQTLLSKEAHNGIDHNKVRSVSHGHWRMKGVAEPIELFETGLDTTHFQPPEDTEKVYRVNLVDDLWVPVKETKHNLTPERNAFIGRTEDLHKLSDVVNADHTRLVTLLGPGGTGKTRLSKRFGRMWLGDYPGGVWFCDLAEAVSLEGIANGVASAMNIPLVIGDPVEQLGNSFAGRGSCLVILDNFEQITEFAEDTLGKWLNMAPGTKFIVTSRNRLHLTGEKTIKLQPLAVNEDGVKLFETRARERGSDFQISEENQEDVHAIVEQLDGMPLAIELAAARIGIMQPRQIRDRLNDRFKLLGTSKGKAKRQETLQAAIDWSWDLLEEYERSALAQCSVFEGGFSLEAAEAVIDLSLFENAPMSFDVLQALVDKSLVKTDVKGYDINEPWFGLYVSIAEYSAMKLKKEDTFEGSGELGQKECWQRHITYYSQFGKEEYIKFIDTKEGLSEAKALQHELDNLMTACKRAIGYKISNEATLLLKALWEVVRIIGPRAVIEAPAKTLIELRATTDINKLSIYNILAEYYSSSDLGEKAGHIADQGLELSLKVKDRRSEGLFSSLKGVALFQTGDIKSGTPYCEKGLKITREVGDQTTEARVLTNLGVSICISDDLDKGKPLLKLALEVSKQSGSLSNESQVLQSFASVYNTEGDAENAKFYIERIFEIARETGNMKNEITALYLLSYTLQIDGKYFEARDHLNKCLMISKEIGDKAMESQSLYSLGILFTKQGKYESASNNIEKSISIGQEIKDPWKECIAHNALGVNHFYAKNYLAAEASYQNCLNVSSKIGMKFMEGASRNGLGIVSVHQGKYDEAFKYLTEAQEIWKDTKWHAGEGYTNRFLGVLYMTKGDHAKAHEYFETAKSATGRINNYELTEVLLDYAKSALANNDKELARAQFNTAVELVSRMELSEEAHVKKDIERLEALIF